MEGPSTPDYSKIVKDYEDKCAALTLLRDTLGAFYDDQKKQLLDKFVSEGVPLATAAQFLKGLVQKSFIDTNELAHYTTRLLSLGTSSEKKTASSVSIDPQAFNWEGVYVTDATPLKVIAPILCRKLHRKEDDKEIAELLELLSAMNGSTVKEVILLDARNREFNVLGDLIAPEQLEIFHRVILMLKELPFVQKKELEEQEQEKKLQELRHKNKQEEETPKEPLSSDGAIHLWGQVHLEYSKVITLLTMDAFNRMHNCWCCR